MKLFDKPEQIRAIVGLGNPGLRYEFTRHNAGFLVLDELASKYNVEWVNKKEMLVGDLQVDSKNILLIKPQTFMNNSGCISQFLSKNGIATETFIVVHDDLELSFGKIKFESGGSAGGHNGLKSIIELCGAGFGRVRFGIGRPENKDFVSNYVLQSFSQEDLEVEAVIKKAADFVEKLIL